MEESNWADSDYESLERLADEFLGRIRRGEHPSIQEYSTRDPVLADRIRELFPTLSILERFRSDSLDRATPDPTRPIPDGLPGALGDFRLLHEIGRGGMGIVYEAEQASLGRRVALKVLRAGRNRDEHQTRFAREARAAARLHHTNIVPTFGFGEAGGVQYYVMQLIDGLGLDKVLKDRRRRGIRPRARIEPAHRATEATRGDTPHRVAAEATGSADVAPTYETEVGTKIGLVDGGAPGEAPPIPRIPDSVLATFRDIGRLGEQAAEALQHAHAHGVLHRDIKPSNILIDEGGDLWITDFGLAKIADQQSLTRSGELLGTVRYMAPEVFEGRSDARSDVFSLGLTIYEMLNLTPAFTEPDPARLLRQVMQSPPPPLLAVCPDIPRDLATIVEKAIERSAEHRYATARELAEDLGRYLRDEPILARRISIAAKLARWCRRNPVVAALSGAIGGLVLVGLVSALIAVARIRHLAGESEKARIATLDAEREAERRLLDSLIAQAQLSRWSNHPGQRFSALSALRQASELGTKLDVGEATRGRLRNEAIASLAMPDLATLRHWQPVRKTTNLDGIDFDPELRHYTLTTSDMTVSDAALTVRRVSDDRVIASLPRADSVPIVSRFSPNGCLLGVGYETSGGITSGGHAFTLWDWANQRTVFELPRGVTKLSLDFSPDSRRVAVGQPDGFVRVFDCENGGLLAELVLEEEPFSIRWHPGGDVLAASCTRAGIVTLWHPKEDRVLCRVSHPAELDVLGIAWSPDGQRLAVACERSVYLWRVRGEFVDEKPEAILDGHSWLVHNVEFHPRGSHLVSHGWEGKTRFWDVRAHRQVLAIDGHFARFDLAGNRLAFRTGSHLGIWNVSGAEECIPLYHELPVHGSASPMTTAALFHPTLPILVASTDTGLKVWDTRTFDDVANVPTDVLEGVSFFPHDGRLLLHTQVAPESIALAFEQRSNQWAPVASSWEFGARLQGARIRSASHDRRGHVVAVVLQGEGKAMVFRNDRKEPTMLDGRPSMALIAVSPDGAWAVTGNQNHPGFEVWNTSTGERVKELATPGTGVAAFSPDGRWVVTADSEKYQFWTVPDWRPAHAVVRRDVPSGGYLALGALAFSADGRWLAVASNQYLVQLVDAEAGNELATLDRTPNPTLVNWLAFSPDRRFLAVCCGGQGLIVWDLDLLRENLDELGLEWPN